MDLAHVGPGTCALEIGCGGGGLLKKLAAHGACAVGVDTLETALTLAQSRGVQLPRGQKQTRASDVHPIALLGCVQIGGNSPLPFRDGSFNAIIGQHVIEHLRDVEQALCEWARVLQPGGRLALATPNARYPDPAHFADSDHAHIYDPNELCEVLERNGFAVQAFFTAFPYLTHYRLLRAFGVIAHRLFQSTPYFASRGRTILVAATKVQATVKIPV